MEITELQKWNIAGEINKVYDFKPIISRLENMNVPPNVKVIRHTLNFHPEKAYKNISYQAIIIDFEGNPVILVGLMINNTILTYYIEDYQYLNEFYMVILEIFSVANDLTFFCFSTYEQQELLRIYTTLNEQGYDLSKYNFITSFPMVIPPITISTFRIHSLWQPQISQLHFPAGYHPGPDVTVIQ